MFAIFQSVVCCAFTCKFLFPNVTVVYMKYGTYKILFQQHFFTQAFETPFLIFLLSQEIIQVEMSWFFLDVCEILVTSAVSHYSFLCLPIASLPVLRLEGQREKWCKNLLVKSDSCIIHEETVPAIKCSGQNFNPQNIPTVLREILPENLNCRLEGFIIITHCIWIDCLNSDKYLRFHLLIWTK